MAQARRNAPLRESPARGHALGGDRGPGLRAGHPEGPRGLADLEGPGLPQAQVRGRVPERGDEEPVRKTRSVMAIVTWVLLLLFILRILVLKVRTRLPFLLLIRRVFPQTSPDFLKGS